MRRKESKYTELTLLLVNIFKLPKQPARKAKMITLDSADGKALYLSKSLSRRSTQGSVATIASFESSAGPAYARIDQRNGKVIRGLVVEFYETSGMSFKLQVEIRFK